MIENKPRRLSDTVSAFAPEGANDARWFLVEHQLVQARTSLRIVVETLAEIIDLPENNDERGLATDCMDMARRILSDILGHYATFLSYLSDTDVPERIARKEL